MNRGRIQAQGGNCEKSESWAKPNIPTKQEGNYKLETLQNQLTRRELMEREQCVQSVRNFIQCAPSSGYDVAKLSFTPKPPKRDVRIDVEIIKGKAFKDDN